MIRHDTLAFAAIACALLPSCLAEQEFQRSKVEARFEVSEYNTPRAFSFAASVTDKPGSTLAAQGTMESSNQYYCDSFYLHPGFGALDTVSCDRALKVSVSNNDAFDQRWSERRTTLSVLFDAHTREYIGTAVWIDWSNFQNFDDTISCAGLIDGDFEDVPAAMTSGGTSLLDCSTSSGEVKLTLTTTAAAPPK